MSKDNPRLLDRLGWSKEEARRFLDNMQKLKASAEQPGDKGEAGKKAYNEFLKNLDLHPRGTQIEGGQTKTDDLRDVRDSGQMEPPGEFADIYHAYLRSAGRTNNSGTVTGEPYVRPTMGTWCQSLTTGQPGMADA